MKPPDNPSKFMSEVLECIASLRDVRGSPPHKIIDYIILSKKAPARNAELLVKKTLKSGVRAGLLKELDGKYKLAMDRKDFRVMRGFCGRKQGDGPMPITEGRRRGRRGRRKGRSKGRRRRRRSPGRRRRALDESGSEEYCTEHMGEPEDRGRRRRRRRRSRRRGGKRRSPRRRRRNASLENSDDADSKEADNSESPEPRGQNNDEEEPSDRGRRRGRRRRSRRRGRSKKRSPRRRRRRRNAEDEEGNGGDDSVESGNGQPAEEAAKERPRRSRSHNRGEEDMGGPGDVPSERRQTPCMYDEDGLNEPDFDHSQYDSKSFS